MSGASPHSDRRAGGDNPRLFVFNGGFLTQKRVRRILHLSGYSLRIGRPGPADMVVVWGNSPTAHRGLNAARKAGCPVLRVEDGFVRSLHPGRAGEPPAGLLLDHNGVHFDPATQSDLETLLAGSPLDDTQLMIRARDGIERMREHHLSKFSGFDPATAAPDPGYVLVIDQTRDDASVLASGADRNRFREMLVFAQEEHPGARVIIKSHPETGAGFRPGYFSQDDTSGRVSLLCDPISPWALLEGAVAVYTVSSHMGFEAILAGHKPRIFGQPFYAGWGLTEDEFPVQRRQRRLTRAQLFAAAMILYPTWYDPIRDRLCDFETMLDLAEARIRAWRDDHRGWVAGGMRLWKRPGLQKMFGRQRRVIFSDDPGRAARTGRRSMVWASQAGEAPARADYRVEDGFLRSCGLGAQLVPPLSLVLDDQGIYYDPGKPSRLEELIAGRQHLSQTRTRRAERLIAALTKGQITKYNTGGPPPPLPEGRRILVPGQVEDDASVIAGATGARSNLDLLRRVRSDNPDAVVIYKPHPDVEAGLRSGAIEAGALADMVVTDTNPAAMLAGVDEVWTITSLIGLEALLRGIPVVTLGAPFYAGWGLTRDLGTPPARRRARPGLAGLVHAALIDYPRYIDPVTGQPCPVEVVVDRLTAGHGIRRGPANRGLSKLQGLLASRGPFWR